jgi:creatinase
MSSVLAVSPELLARPDVWRFRNGDKPSLPFSHDEYARRLGRLRAMMRTRDISAVVFTSMHNVAYYSGFLYCSFGRPYGCVVTLDECVTVSANIDGGQPWRRSVGDNVVYTDWHRDNFWRAVLKVVGKSSRVGVEFDHLSLAANALLAETLPNAEVVDIAPDVMLHRTIKSVEEIELITAGAAVADIGGFAVRESIRVGATEYEVAAAGRGAMEAEIARRFPGSEIRDTWVWFQSGLNTDGAHNPVTTRQLVAGDILSVNTFPMISGYYTALERTLFLGEPDAQSLEAWEANVAAHELGCSLLRPGAVCADICEELNAFFNDCGLLEYRTFGYGHSFGVLSHYYGREAAVELREDVTTVLEPGMVVSMEPMLTIPEGTAGAGGYREHDILVIEEAGATNITGFPYGPEHNVIAL